MCTDSPLICMCCTSSVIAIVKSVPTYINPNELCSNLHQCVLGWTQVGACKNPLKNVMVPDSRAPWGMPGMLKASRVCQVWVLAAAQKEERQLFKTL